MSDLLKSSSISKTSSLNLNEKQIKTIRLALFALVIMACYFVVTAAWTDLYNPGSELAKNYQFYAEVTLGLMVLLALPLWDIKLHKINAWMESMSSIDDPILRNKVWWMHLRPIITQIVVIAIVTVIMYYVINTYFKIPDEVITNYTHYYVKPKVEFLP